MISPPLSVVMIGSPSTSATTPARCSRRHGRRHPCGCAGRILPPPSRGSGSGGGGRPTTLTLRVSVLWCGVCAGFEERSILAAALVGSLAAPPAMSAVWGLGVVRLSAGAIAAAVVAAVVVGLAAADYPAASCEGGRRDTAVDAATGCCAGVHRPRATAAASVAAPAVDGADAGDGDPAPLLAGVAALVLLAAVATAATTTTAGFVACCGCTAAALAGAAGAPFGTAAAAAAWRVHLPACAVPATPAAAAAVASLGSAWRMLADGVAAVTPRRRGGGGSPNMNSLVALSAGVGTAASAVGALPGAYPPFFHEPLATLAVVGAGRALEGLFRRRAVVVAGALAAMQPAVALRW